MATADLSPTRSAGAALEGRLGLLARRRNAQKMGRALVRAAIPGVGLAGASVLLYKLHIIPDGPSWAPAAIIGVFLLWGLRNGRLQRAGKFAAACDADRALALDDRLSSALSFVAPSQVQRQTRMAPQGGLLARLRAAIAPKFATSIAPAAQSTDLVPALVDEAASRAQSLDAKRVYPLPFDRSAQVLTVLTLAFIGFCLMPDMPLFQTAQEKQQVAAMQSAGEKLVAVAKNVQKTAPPKAEEVQQLARHLEKLGQKMMRGRMTKRAALTEIGELRQKLEKAQAPRKSASQSASMPQIAEALRQAPLQSETGRKVQKDLAQNKWDEAAKELEELADKVDKNELSQAEKEKAASDLDKTAQDLRQRGGEANQQAADKLESAANQLRQQQPGQQEQKKQESGSQSQNGQNQNGQNQQGKQGQQGQQQQQGQGQQGQGQQQQQKQGQGQQGPGQQPGKQPGQQQQSGGQQQQQGQNKQGQQGQSGQQGQQQQQGQQSQGQSGAGQQQQPQQGQGQQGQSGAGQQGQGQQQGQGAGNALRDMANGLRQGGSSGSNSQNLQDMMNKLRDAENQTGTNGGQQYGNVRPSQGQGGNPGQGQMKNVTPGKDLVASDPHGQVGGGAGLGPRNNAQGVQSGGGVSNKKSTRTGDKRRYEDIWSDRLPKTHKKIDRINGKWGGSGEVEQMPTKGEAKGGQVKTPYYEVYESYKHDAEEAVGRDSVPPAYKQPVKDYFESIKP